LTIKRQCENQNEQWLYIHNLKLCKCGIRIPINQDTRYICWKWDKLDRDHQRRIRKGFRKIFSYEALQERYINIEDGEITDDNWLDFHIKQKF